MPSVDELPRQESLQYTECPLCDASLNPANPNECPRCDWVLGYRRRQQQPIATGRDTAALVMSIVPGLGHLYKGHPLMAALFFIGALIAGFVAIVAAAATMGLAVGLLPIYWAGTMLHVYWLGDRKGPSPGS